MRFVGRSPWDLIEPRKRLALRLLRDASPGLFVWLLVDLVAMAVLPNAVLVALGVLVGRIPAAIGDGLDSPAGDRLDSALVFVAVAFAAAMLVAPAHQALGSAIKVRLTYAMQSRLMTAVSRPAGISHLEDPATLDRLGMAQGTLMSWFPADAPAALATVWSNRLTAVLAAGLIGWQVWWLGLAFLVLWPLTRRPIMRVITEHVNALGGNVDVMRRAEYFRQLATRPQAAKELRLFGLEDWVVEQYRTTWAEGMADVWTIRAGIHRVILRVGVVLLTAYTGAAAYLAWAAHQGDLDLRAIAILLPALGVTMTSGGVNFDDISLAWMLSALPHLDDLEGAMALRSADLTGAGSSDGLPRSEIRFDGVTFRYPGSDVPVFEGLDLTIRAGASTAIVGVNGAGKTTLVKLLARLHEPTSGRILVDGTDLRLLDAAGWQRRVSVVFQDFLRLPLDARDNVGLGAVDHLADVDGIAAAAERAGIADVIDQLPSGWSTILSPQFVGGVDLSGGQWQRVALARALFAARHGASLLVLDEPTASMDVRGEATFFARFLEITAGLTTVVISHRFSTVRLADRICVIGEGGLLEEGSHDELLALGGSYAEMFRLQASRFVEVAE